MTLFQVCEIGSDWTEPLLLQPAPYIVIIPQQEIWSAMASFLRQAEAKVERKKDIDLFLSLQQADPEAGHRTGSNEKDVYSSSHWVPQVIEVLNFDPDPYGQ